MRLWPTVHGDGYIAMDDYTGRLEQAKLLAKAHNALEEMRKTEGFAYTEDSYTARIPGKTLKRWHDALHSTLFRLRSELE